MAPLHVIQLGLPWNYKAFDDKQQQQVKDLLTKGREKMSSAGYNYREFDVTPEEGMNPLITYLKENKVDAVVIGMGIRRMVEMTEFMEQLIDTTRTYAPKSKVLFNTSPDSAMEAVQRWFSSNTS